MIGRTLFESTRSYKQGYEYVTICKGRFSCNLSQSSYMQPLYIYKDFVHIDFRPEKFSLLFSHLR